MGKCPDCGMQIGPMSILVGWDNWGKFVCPGCGEHIKFRGWLLAVIALMGLMIGVERLLHLMIISKVSIGWSFLVSFILAMMVMFVVPMIWRFDRE